MIIDLKNIKPEPLREFGLDAQSALYATQCSFEQGKKYLVTAASGKGKSTFLHIIYGLRRDYTGECSIDQRNISQYSADEWAQLRAQRISIVFQDLRLFPQLTALENIVLKNDLTQALPQDRILDMAAKLGMTAHLNQKAETLSYGQRQRIAIIRALCQPFQMLLLDEPFSHLDSENIRLATQLIEQRCHELSAGLILVSLGEKYFFEYNQLISI